MPNRRPLSARGLRRLWQREEGSVTIPSVLFLPFFLMVLVSTVDLSMITIRQSLLDRAVDDTARIMRLGIEPMPDHTTLKRGICNRVALAPDCMESLTVEVIEIDKKTWSTARAGTAVSCIDHSQQDSSEMLLQRGQEDQLMMMRVCMKIKPMMTSTGLGGQLIKDSTGAIALVSVTAFVNEPN
jgi:Flp pilus assembly protein TadG